MKKLLLLFFTTLLLLGCETEAKLTFDTVRLKNDACKNCPKIEITIPKALGKTRIAETINNTLEEELIYTLKFDDSLNVNSVKDAMQSFTKSYQNLSKLHADEVIGWEAKANGEVGYKNSFLLSIAINTYIFTGGAHGYSATTFLNFDIEKNIELEPYELFKDYEGFITLAETMFKKANNIPIESPINKTGFMFSNDNFHLPEQLGFNKEGILLIYNQYEITSYADGPIELVIPFADASPFLKENYRG